MIGLMKIPMLFGISQSSSLRKLYNLPHDLAILLFSHNVYAFFPDLLVMILINAGDRQVTPLFTTSIIQDTFLVAWLHEFIRKKSLLEIKLLAKRNAIWIIFE